MVLGRVIGSRFLQRRPDDFSPKMLGLFIRCNLQAGSQTTSLISNFLHRLLEAVPFSVAVSRPVLLLR